MEAGSLRMEAGSPRMEAGSLCMEAGCPYIDGKLLSNLGL